MTRNGSKRDTKSDKRAPETIDGETGKPEGTPPTTGAAAGDKPQRRIDLSTLRDVRLELAAVYRLMNSGEIESQDGTRRAYVLKTIADVITLAELEKRIQELEDRHATAALPGQRQLPARTLN